MNVRLSSILCSLLIALGAGGMRMPYALAWGQGCDQAVAETIRGAKTSVWDVSHVDISRVQPTRKLIALTFDDAPSKTIEEIVAAFLHFNETHPDCPATATLFCNGKHVVGGAMDALKAAHKAQFELGNHTHNHEKLTALSPTQLRREISETDKVLGEIDGEALHLLRAPYGEINEEVRSAAKTPIIDWLIDTKDWMGISPKEIYEAAFSQKADGAIVLMHDGYKHTVTALKQLLPDLYDAGYQAVSVSQMAKAHSCPLKIGNVYIRARKFA